MRGKEGKMNGLRQSSLVRSLFGVPSSQPGKSRRVCSRTITLPHPVSRVRLDTVWIYDNYGAVMAVLSTPPILYNRKLRCVHKPDCFKQVRSCDEPAFNWGELITFYPMYDSQQHTPNDVRPFAYVLTDSEPDCEYSPMGSLSPNFSP